LIPERLPAGGMSGSAGMIRRTERTRSFRLLSQRIPAARFHTLLPTKTAPTIGFSWSRECERERAHKPAADARIAHAETVACHVHNVLVLARAHTTHHVSINQTQYERYEWVAAGAPQQCRARTPQSRTPCETCASCRRIGSGRDRQSPPLNLA
jgi:hypothetical protein